MVKVEATVMQDVIVKGEPVVEKDSEAQVFDKDSEALAVRVKVEPYVQMESHLRPENGETQRKLVEDRRNPEARDNGLELPTGTVVEQCPVPGELDLEPCEKHNEVQQNNTVTCGSQKKHPESQEKDVKSENDMQSQVGSQAGDAKPRQHDSEAKQGAEALVMKKSTEPTQEEAAKLIPSMLPTKVVAIQNAGEDLTVDFEPTMLAFMRRPPIA